MGNIKVSEELLKSRVSNCQVYLLLFSDSDSVL